MNTTKRRQSIEINNKTYNRFLKFIEEEMERRGCSQNKMGETLGVTGTTLGEKLRKINRLFADDMCEWMEILGIKIFYPGEEPPITGKVPDDRGLCRSEKYRRKNKNIKKRK